MKEGKQLASLKLNATGFTCGILLSILICLRIAIHLNWIATSHFENVINWIENNVRFQIILFCLPLYLLWRRYKYCQRFNQLPGFKTHFGIIGDLRYIWASLKRIKCAGVTISELANSIHFHSLHSKKEDRGIFVTWVAYQPLVFVFSPDLLREILNIKDIKKGRNYDFLRLLQGDGLVITWAKKWLYHRKLLTPAFNFKVLESFVPNMLSNVEILLSKLEQEAQSNPDRVIKDLKSFIFPCTLDILCHSSMGVDAKAQSDPNSQICDSLHVYLMAFTDVSLKPWLRMQNYSFFRPLTSFGREVNRNLKIFHDFTKKVTQERLELISNTSTSVDSESNRKVQEPFIDTCIREHLLRPKIFSLKDVRDEVNTFMSAGHDTSGWALTYALFMIGHHPHVQAKVHEEVDMFFSEMEKEEITVESLKKLKYIDAVIKETLRLYPTVPMPSRQLDSDIKLGRFVIPRGALIMIGIHQVHRDPQYWSEPARFKPERFLEGQMCHPYAYIPFSAGPRNCIGQRYAMVQVKSLIALFMRYYSIQSLDPIESILTVGVPLAQTNSPIRVKLVGRQNY